MVTMPIGKLRRATRSIARYREILGALVRFGLADWAKRIEIDFAAEILASQADPQLLALSHEQRVRQALMELGPTFIKLGQTLSVRPDLVGVPLADELKKLQNNVTADPFETVRKTVERELGGSVEQFFDRFDPIPVASASIGQVHRARLKNGDEVAVKIRRAGIEKTVAVDLEILRDLARLVEEYVEDARYYRPKETVERFARTLTRELDFTREARNIKTMAEQLIADPRLLIPAVTEELVTREVLVMEWVDGVLLEEGIERLSDEERGRLGREGAEVFLKMILVDGFYHADPHPGNFMLVEEGARLALLDFGMVGRLSERMREHVEDIVASLVTQDTDRLTRAITKAGTLPNDFDREGLATDLTELVSYYAVMPVAKIDMAHAIAELVEVIHRHHIVLASEVVALMRTMMTLDGTGRLMSPTFNLYSLVAPYRRELAASRLNPLRQLARTRRLYYDVADFMETVPSAIADILERFRDGTMEIHMEHRGFEYAINRLVLGILAAAIFMGSSMLLSAATPPTVFGVSLFGMLGWGVAIAMIFRALWAIMISGRLD